MGIEEIEAKIEMIAKDRENLINELENARLIDNGEILVFIENKTIGVTGYLGYENFRIFCDELIRKYLRKEKK